MAQTISSVVFRAYDIRGVVDKELSEDALYLIGKAVATRLTELGRTQICIGHDVRLSSQRFSDALAKGLQDSGIDVFDLGEVSTPVMYFATKTSGIDSGLIVTGSHNPADYNGVKIVLAGKTLVQEDINHLYELITADAFVKPQHRGAYNTQPITEAYINRIVSDITLTKKLKVVVDCGNGVAGPIVLPTLKALGCEVIPLYCDVDGRFPNHHPDPTVEENLQDLITAVKAHGADLGLGFDGDADRLGLVTATGEIIWPDRLMMLYAKHILKEEPGACIVYDVKCTKNLGEAIHRAGGKPHMSPTGHSIVKSLMLEKNAALAGEMSGHIFFKHRWYGFDDALYSACRLLEIIGADTRSLDEIFSDIPNSVHTPEIKIPVSEENKFDLMQRFAATTAFADATYIRIDGLRAEFSFGWGLVRASNTTPCLVARFEAESEVYLEKIQALFKAALQAIDSELAIPF